MRERERESRLWLYRQKVVLCHLWDNFVCNFLFFTLFCSVMFHHAVSNTNFGRAMLSWNLARAKEIQPRRQHKWIIHESERKRKEFLTEEKKISIKLCLIFSLFHTCFRTHLLCLSFVCMQCSYSIQSFVPSGDAWHYEQDLCDNQQHLCRVSQSLIIKRRTMRTKNVASVVVARTRNTQLRNCEWQKESARAQERDRKKEKTIAVCVCVTTSNADCSINNKSSERNGYGEKKASRIWNITLTIIMCYTEKWKLKVCRNSYAKKCV